MNRDLRRIPDLAQRYECTIAAAIGAVGAIGGSLISANASSNATAAAQQAAAANNAIAQQQFGAVESAAQPYITSGNAANTELNGLLGIGGDPKAAAAAFQTFTGSDGYQFRLDQGLGAVTGNSAVNGLLNSGSTLKALNNYAQGTASQEFGTYVGDLGGAATRGLYGVNALSGAAKGLTDSVSASNNNLASSIGTANFQNASSINTLLQSALSSAQNINGARNASSYGGQTAGVSGTNGAINPFAPTGY